MGELELNTDNISAVAGPGFGRGGSLGNTVTRTFELERLTNKLTYCVAGHRVNTANEVRVEVNGTFVGHLNAGANGTITCFDVPASALRVGINTVLFSQQGGDGVWGINNVQVKAFNAGSIVGAIMLLLSDEEPAKAAQKIQATPTTH